MACQASGTADRIRRGGTRPSAHSTALPLTSPIATAAGTTAGGSISSIGTRISCVGTTNPAPTGNSIRPTTAYTATRSTATCGRRPAIPPVRIWTAAAATNSPAAEASTTSSRWEARRSRASQLFSSSRSVADCDSSA